MDQISPGAVDSLSTTPVVPADIEGTQRPFRHSTFDVLLCYIFSLTHLESSILNTKHISVYIVKVNLFFQVSYTYTQVHYIYI